MDAYVSRIGQFQSKGAMEDAQTLINLVTSASPPTAADSPRFKLRAAAAEGKIDDLVAPLARPELPREQREAIESALRREWVDLPALAGCRRPARGRTSCGPPPPRSGGRSRRPPPAR